MTEEIKETIEEKSKETEEAVTPKENVGESVENKIEVSESGEGTKMEKDKEKENEVGGWEPKTELGRKVKNGEIKNIDEVIENNYKILEPEIVDSLLNVQTELVSMGQSKGKFGGGKRRAWRQTQRKTREGNVPKFSAMALVGDGEGHIGMGVGEAMETLPSRDKAIRKAKLNIQKIDRTCSAFDCSCTEKHTIPFKVKGDCGGVRVVLIPAPQGTGLVVADELKKIFQLIGIKDVYSKTFGSTRTTFNLIKACLNALEKTKIKENKK